MQAGPSGTRPAEPDKEAGRFDQEPDTPNGLNTPNRPGNAGDAGPNPPHALSRRPFRAAGRHPAGHPEGHRGAHQLHPGRTPSHRLARAEPLHHHPGRVDCQNRRLARGFRHALGRVGVIFRSPDRSLPIELLPGTGRRTGGRLLTEGCWSVMGVLLFIIWGKLDGSVRFMSLGSFFVPYFYRGITALSPASQASLMVRHSA